MTLDVDDGRPAGLPSNDPHAQPAMSVIAAYGRGLFAVTPQVLAVPRLPAEAIRRLAFHRLRETIDHAMRHVPFYRDRLRAAGVDPQAIRTDADVARIPVLTRVLHRKHWPEMISDAVARADVLERRPAHALSARIVFDPLRELPRRLQELRFLTAHGFRPWHRQVILDQPENLSPGKFIPQRVGLWRREAFPTWLGVDESLRWLRKEKPEVIHGVLSSVRLLSAAVRQRGGLGYVPRMVVTKDGFLDTTSRTVLESSLGARVVDYFATPEAGIVAWRCPAETGYHVDEDMVFVETVRDDGSPTEAGERGNLVLTNLYMRAMPIIRLQIGERAVLSREPCRCGRSLALIKGLREYHVASITTPTGVIRTPEALSSVLEGIPTLKGFRLVQSEVGCLSVVVCWQGGLAEQAKRAASRQIIDRLGDELESSMRIDLREVETFFPPGPVPQRTALGRLPRT